MTAVRVIACGNPDGGDDAAGLEAVREAAPRLAAMPGVEIVEAGPAVRVLDALEGAPAAVVVDAVRTRERGREPGSIVRIEVDGRGLGAELDAAVSSHGLGLGEMVGLGVALGKVDRLVFLGIEAGDVRTGAGLSPPIAAAVPELARRIEMEARSLREGGSP